MILVRFLLILFILGGVLYFSLHQELIRSYNITDKLAGAVNNQLSQASQKIPALKNFQDVLGMSSAVSKIDLKSINTEDVKTFAQSLPSQIQEQLPKIEELVTNTKKEELYLKAPVDFTLPEVSIEPFDEVLTVQLSAFEIKDTRKSGHAWSLVIGAGDLVSPKSTIKKENINFILKKQFIEAHDGGSVEDLLIEDGAQIKVSAKPGLGKGLFRIRPEVSVKIVQGSYSGTYRAQLSSTLE